MGLQSMEREGQEAKAVRNLVRDQGWIKMMIRLAKQNVSLVTVDMSRSILTKSSQRNSRTAHCQQVHELSITRGLGRHCI
jgi:hypothetical protein